VLKSRVDGVGLCWRFKYPFYPWLTGRQVARGEARRARSARSMQRTTWPLARPGSPPCGQPGGCMCACALLDATVRQFRPGSRQRASEVNACRPPHRPEQSEVGGPSGRACVHRRPVVVLGLCLDRGKGVRKVTSDTIIYFLFVCGNCCPTMI